MTHLTGNGQLHHLSKGREDIFDGATLLAQIDLVHSLLVHLEVLVSRHGNGTQVTIIHDCISIILLLR